MTAHILAGTEQ